MCHAVEICRFRFQQTDAKVEYEFPLLSTSMIVATSIDSLILQIKKPASFQWFQDVSRFKEHRWAHLRLLLRLGPPDRPDLSLGSPLR